MVLGARSRRADDVSGGDLLTRIIDGREAVQFLVAIKEALEDPGRMLLGI